MASVAYDIAERTARLGLRSAFVPARRAASDELLSEIPAARLRH
jgi:hypothetical protein